MNVVLVYIDHILEKLYNYLCMSVMQFRHMIACNLSLHI